MLSHKGYVYCLKPSPEQVTLLSKHFGHVRFVKNWAIALKSRYYKIYGNGISKRRLQDQLVKKKQRTAFAWLGEVNSQSLLAALVDVDNAYKRFFTQGAGHPKFASKYDAWQSFSCPQHVRLEGSRVHLPKFGLMDLVLHRQIPHDGKIKNCVIKRSPTGKYQISLLVERNMNEVVPTPVARSESIGVDLGIKTFVVCSDGYSIQNPRFLSKQLPRLKIEQRKFARMQKGSNNRAKQKKLVAKIHEDVANARHHFLHQESYRLAVKNHATTVMMETLMIKNMVRNRSLARHIADCGWGMFGKALEYKLFENGKNLIKIDTFLPSTKQCRICKTKNASITLNDRVFVCGNCNHTENRDLHAAKNIRDFGYEQHTRSLGTYETVKRSPSSLSVGADEFAKGSNKIGMGRSKEAPARFAHAN